jgi:phosphate transport system permease protein
MTLTVLLIVIVLAGVAFVLGQRRATRRAALLTGKARAHSRPAQHGAYALIWVAAPAILVLAALAVLSGPITQTLVENGQPDAVRSLEGFRKNAFMADAARVAHGQPTQAIWEPEVARHLAPEGARAARIEATLNWAGAAGAILAALIGGLIAFMRIRPDFRARNRVEGWIVGLLLICSAIAILTTIGIIASLLIDATRFFSAVPLPEFLFGTQWSPQTAIRADQVGSTGAFGALPLFAGTFLIMLIAMAVAAPVGLFAAIYLSEYASATSRAIIKPVLEILAGVPTVVYGFFAALTVGPAFREGFNTLGRWLVGGPLDGLGQYLMLVQNQMALVAGAVMGIMLIPFVSSLSDDILNAVPQSLRDGSYAMGATKSETVSRVLMPAALPGVAGALLLAMSRAIGETMIVTMAAGLAARLTLNPLDTVTTVTVQIVTLLTGDQEFNSTKTLAAFGLGLTLFVVTLALNVIAQRIVQTYRQQYD